MENEFTTSESTDPRIIGIKIKTLGQELSNILYCIYLICDNEKDSNDIENELDSCSVSISISEKITVVIDKKGNTMSYIKFIPNEAHLNILGNELVTKIATAYIYKGQVFYNPDFSISR